jgi:hypothetical protein
VLKAGVPAFLVGLVRAACIATEPDSTYSWKLTSRGKQIVSVADIPCDGMMTVNGVGELPPGAPARVTISSERDVIRTAYAIVASKPTDG